MGLPGLGGDWIVPVNAFACAFGSVLLLEALARGRDALIDLGFEAVDYLELRDAETLAPLDEATRPARLLAAVHIDGCRLIDNITLVSGGDMY